MIQRVTNPRHPRYASYGGRGIAIDPEWRSDFRAFLRDVGERPSRDLTLDRIDVNGDYVPGNVRWADAVTQRRNQRVRNTQKG